MSPTPTADPTFSIARFGVPHPESLSFANAGQVGAHFNLGVNLKTLKLMVRLGAIMGVMLLASLSGGVDNAEAEAFCTVSSPLGRGTVGFGNKAHISCDNTFGTEARGVVNCRWSPDPKTGWVEVGSRTSWAACSPLLYRGTHIDVRGR